jgi:hypothetical protein
MDYTTLIGPAVVAAVIAGLISVITLLMNRATTLSMHSQRLAFDREQAERRVNAEIALADRKVTLDRALAAWKRRTELAEEVLADFYKARDIIEAARSPGGFGDEGATRQKQPWETEDDTRTLNAYFRTIERLNAHGDFFSQLFARSHRFIALFGSEAVQPFDELWHMRGKILIAVRMLIATHQQQQHGNLPEARAKWEATIGWAVTGQDPIQGQLDAIVAAVENICRPVIQDVAP